MNDYKMVEVKLNKGNTSPERSERTNYCEETKGVQIEEIILKPQEVATFTLSIEGYIVKMAAYNDSKKSETLINMTINSLVCFCGDRRASKNIFAIHKGVTLFTPDMISKKIIKDSTIDKYQVNQFINKRVPVIRVDSDLMENNSEMQKTIRTIMPGTADYATVKELYDSKIMVTISKRK